MFSQSLTHQNTILSKRFHNAHDSNKTNVRNGISFLEYAIKQKIIAIIETQINICIGKGIHRAPAVFNTLAI